jgi:hypothetical protein
MGRRYLLAQRIAALTNLGCSASSGRLHYQVPRTGRDSGPLNWNGRRVGAISLAKRGSKRLPVETHGLDHGVNWLAL